eukprot:3342110-Amphidinium_carterae.3
MRLASKPRPKALYPSKEDDKTKANGRPKPERGTATVTRQGTSQESQKTLIPAMPRKADIPESQKTPNHNPASKGNLNSTCPSTKPWADGRAPNRLK